MNKHNPSKTRQYWWKVFTKEAKNFDINRDNYNYWKILFEYNGWPEMIEDLNNYLLKNYYK